MEEMRTRSLSALRNPLGVNVVGRDHELDVKDETRPVILRSQVTALADHAAAQGEQSPRIGCSDRPCRTGENVRNGVLWGNRPLKLPFLAMRPFTRSTRRATRDSIPSTTHTADPKSMKKRVGGANGVPRTSSRSWARWSERGDGIFFAIAGCDANLACAAFSGRDMAGV
jgi:hypothetical protein